MDWTRKSWEVEDAEYTPKRKVANRGSKDRPHIIGAFHSFKMNREVEYESLNEYLLYAILELDPSTARYYVQPVEVPIPHNKNGKLQHWMHVPDVLVYRQGFRPQLCQVKGSADDVSERTLRINHFCTRYAEERDWDYRMIGMKSISPVVAKNAERLVGYLKPRDWYETLLPQVVSRLAFHGSSTVGELASGFQPNFHYLQVIPAVYYLIANGTFSVMLDLPVNESSTITINSGESNLGTYLEMGESSGL